MKSELLRVALVLRSVWRSGRGLWTVGVVLNHEEHFSVESEDEEKETPTSPLSPLRIHQDTDALCSPAAN